MNRQEEIAAVTTAPALALRRVAYDLDRKLRGLLDAVSREDAECKKIQRTLDAQMSKKAEIADQAEKTRLEYVEMREAFRKLIGVDMPPNSDY